MSSAAKDSVSLTNISAKEKNRLTASIKSTIARQLWRNDGYFEVHNMNDAEIKKAIEVIKQ
ncbi:MAG: hypothetical protein IPP48_14235 [Chitinophagaceae bacterium]|nr:hypothetical protein [Chitinophagaceae bacterium]